jgi:hypothetical protein
MALAFELAQLAARHIAEEGLSYFEAKRKAAKQVGVAEHHAAMPSNSVIEQALRDYQAEFMADSQPKELARLRALAANWLTHLAQLLDLNESCWALAVGAVVNGTAGEHSPVHLHVFTDEVKHFEIALLNAGFELEYTEQKVEGSMRPVLVAQDQGVPIAITLMPRQRYVAPQTSKQDDYAQAATLTQLQSMMTQLSTGKSK